MKKPFPGMPVYSVPLSLRDKFNPYDSLMSDIHARDAKRLLCNPACSDSDVKDALRLADRALRKMPTHAKALTWRGIGLFRMQDFEGARNILEMALDSSKTPPIEAYEYLGQCLLQMGGQDSDEDLFNRARSCFQRLIDAKHKPAFAYAHLGILHARIHESDTAEIYFKQALKLDPDSSFVLREYGTSLQQTDPARAEYYLLEAYKLAQGEKVETQIAILDRLLKLYRFHDCAEEAEECAWTILDKAEKTGFGARVDEMLLLIFEMRKDQWQNQATPEPQDF